MNDGSRMYVVTMPLTAPSAAESTRTAATAAQVPEPSRIRTAPTTMPIAYSPPTDRSTSRMASGKTMPQAISPT